MRKRWNIAHPDEEKVSSLQSALGVSQLICSLLVHRGIETFDEAKHFFRPELTDLHDPYLMKDMAKAVNRIITALENGENILVFGDYDVDGTTAVACMYSFLRRLTGKIDFYVPHRYREGYGVSRAGIDFAFKNGYTLIISLDCGIKSVDLIRYARSLGIDFVVCDHHLPDQELPPAIAILNPKQPGCDYPYKELCGCGVGFKLIQAISQGLKLSNDIVYANIDLVATAIAADIVPITGENRVLAYYGLKKANTDPNHGIKALSFLSSLKKELLINNLVFMIAPRVNAAGRMDDARKAVQMFIADSYEEALLYAEQLHVDNTNRKEADSSITTQALSMIRENAGWEERKSTVVFNADWHKGVVGIVASRLIEHYHRPTIVLTRSGDYVAGSARSVPGFNLYEAVHACREHLLGYGGHFAAAGMTMEPQKVEIFRDQFEKIVSSTIDPRFLVPAIDIDAEVSFSQLSLKLYNIIRQMEPFGPGNLSPVFISRGAINSNYTRIVKEDHIRFVLRHSGIILTGIGFGMASRFNELKPNSPLDIVYKIEENEWEGQKSLQIKMIDFYIPQNN